MRRIAFVLLAMLSTGAANAAPYGGTFSGGPGTSGYGVGASPEPRFYYGAWLDVRTSEKLGFVSQMIDLQDRGARLQKKDGGSLTPEHRALLQSKLDKLQASYASSDR